MGDDDRRLVRTVLPEFAQELADALTADGRQDLADQVQGLTIWRPCGCRDDFCASFHTGPERAWRDQGPRESVLAFPDLPRGLVAVDVVDGLIDYVEVLDRPDVQKAVDG